MLKIYTRHKNFIISKVEAFLKTSWKLQVNFFVQLKHVIKCSILSSQSSTLWSTSSAIFHDSISLFTPSIMKLLINFQRRTKSSLPAADYLNSIEKYRKHCWKFNLNFWKFHFSSLSMLWWTERNYSYDNFILFENEGLKSSHINHQKTYNWK